MDKPSIAHLPIDILKLNPRNARKHGKKQIRQIATSMRAFGFTNPVLIDEGNMVLAGHGRIEAARLLGLEEIPTVRLDHMTEAEKRAYVLADNKLAENADWDREILVTEFTDLIEVELEFDVEITGFETAEIDLLVEGARAKAVDEAADKIPPVASGHPVSVVGDLWRLGQHRMLCGDASSAEDVARLMAGGKARMVFTDPPYNLPIDGFVSGKGRARHREFVMGSGEMSEEAFAQFLEAALTYAAEHSEDGALHYVCMDWRHLHTLLVAGRSAYDAQKALCVWNKANGGMGSLYRSKHELISVFKVGKAPHVNNVQLGRYGRYRTNVWDYPGVNISGFNGTEQKDNHPTIKPVALVADAILDASRRGDIVLDPFSGSGTTIMAAERTGRRAHVLELDPLYVDSAIRRWQEYGGEAAVHGATGQTFGEIEKQRRAAVVEAVTGGAEDDPLRRHQKRLGGSDQ
jgi:DNA modification methylase